MPLYDVKILTTIHFFKELKLKKIFCHYLYVSTVYNYWARKSRSQKFIYMYVYIQTD